MNVEKEQLQEAPEKTLPLLFWELNKRFNRSLQYLLDPYGLTTSQFEILGSLHMAKSIYGHKEVSQVELSKATFIDPMTTSTIIRNLEKKGFVTRKQSKRDSRALNVSLSQKSKQILSELKEKIERHRSEIYRGIDEDQARKLLETLIERMKDRYHD